VEVTDGNGQAVFPGLTARAVSVVASAETFYSNEARQVDLAAGQETVLTIELQRHALVSETVVVTGSGTESLVQETPIRTELISPECERR